MNTQKKLQSNPIVHVILLVSSVLFAFVYHYFTNNGYDSVKFIGLSCIIFFDFEVAFLVIHRFKRLNAKYKNRLSETKSVSKIVFTNLFGLIIFFTIFIAANTFGTIVFVIVLHHINGWAFPDILKIAIDGGVMKATAIALLYAVPFFLFQKWVESMKNEFKLKEQNLIFQNETLKSQVNPHFLFNSLNTLTSLINNEVEIANRFVSKLSLIYRYILDNSAKTKIALKEELDFIRDFFYMHQIRNEGKIILNIDVKENGYGFEILPVSLQLLVENAIKHNMATTEKPLIIRIYLEDGYIVIQNNIQKMASQIVSTKIGLKNLNERVRLVTGKEVIILESEEKFIVKVPLMA